MYKLKNIFLQFLKMAPAPYFGVFLDFAYLFLTEVDFNMHIIYVHTETADLC